EYDHFLGNTGNTITLAYDRVSMATLDYAYGNDPNAGDLAIPPGSKQQFTTLLLRGIFNLGPKLNLTLSNYWNQYQDTYSSNIAVNAAQLASIPGLVAGTVNPLLSLTTTSFSHYDARLGLVYRPSTTAAIRFAAGSAIAPPYLFLLNASNGVPALSADGTFYTNSVNAGTLKPETAFGYDLGGDFRLSADGRTILSTDLYLNNVFNQFLSQTYLNGTYNGLPLYSSSNVNLGNARYQGIEVSINRDPPLGFGFTTSGALQQAYPYNINPCFYSTTIANGVQNCTVFSTNLGIVPGINFQNSGTTGTACAGCGSGSGSWAVSNHSEPYSQGYFELHYRFPRSGYLGFGMQYLGPNNSLNVPAFWMGSLSVRVPVANRTWVQVAVDNLFNNYSSPYVQEWGGVPVVLVNGKIGLTNANVIGPRNLRLSLTRNFGGP
ncbi:MAG: TonB-dependent receptor, partial [Candidatus Eremiobacteraeota bacterium]|nr:TonB-dependent receptor [Candidatus Eremiobacteraeota bacterium]